MKYTSSIWNSVLYTLPRACPTTVDWRPAQRAHVLCRYHQELSPARRTKLKTKKAARYYFKNNRHWKSLCRKYFRILNKIKSTPFTQWFNWARLKITCSYRSHTTTLQGKNLFYQNMLVRWFEIYLLKRLLDWTHDERPRKLFPGNSCHCLINVILKSSFIALTVCLPAHFIFYLSSLEIWLVFAVFVF